MKKQLEQKKAEFIERHCLYYKFYEQEASKRFEKQFRQELDELLACREGETEIKFAKYIEDYAVFRIDMDEKMVNERGENNYCILSEGGKRRYVKDLNSLYAEFLKSLTDK